MDQNWFSNRLAQSGFIRWASAVPATLLVVGVVLIPRANGQARGPITPDPSSPPQQTAPQSPAASAAKAANMAGTWKLNVEQSDDAREKMREAMGSGQTRGRQGRGGWGGNGQGGPANGGGWNGGQQQGGRRGSGGFMDADDFSQLGIEQSDSSAKVTGATGRVLALYSANSTGADSTSNSSGDSNVPPTARMEGQQLIVQQQMGRGGKSTRTYELSPDRTQLFVTTRMENPRFSEPVVIRLVYDPVKPR